MSSLFEEWIYRYGYPIMIGGGLLIIVIYIIYYWIRSKKVDKQYKKYKEDQSMTQIHQPISLHLYINCPLLQKVLEVFCSCSTLISKGLG